MEAAEKGRRENARIGLPSPGTPHPSLTPPNSYPLVRRTIYMRWHGIDPVEAEHEEILSEAGPEYRHDLKSMHMDCLRPLLQAEIERDLGLTP